MARAHYTIFVPNHVKNVALAAHHYLSTGPIRGIDHVHVSFGHPEDKLEVVGEHTPELDSHMKQTGAFIAEVANEPYIGVMRWGKNLAYWPIHNPHYQPRPAGGVPPALDKRPDEVPLPSAGPQPPTTPTTLSPSPPLQANGEGELPLGR